MSYTRKPQHKGQGFGTGVQKTCTSRVDVIESWQVYQHAKDDGEVMTLLAGAVIVFCMGSIMRITRERLKEHRSKAEPEGRFGGDGINERHDYTDL